MVESSLMGPKYGGKYLEGLLKDLKLHVRLHQTLTNVVIPTSDIKRLEPIVFSSYKGFDKLSSSLRKHWRVRKKIRYRKMQMHDLPAHSQLRPPPHARSRLHFLGMLSTNYSTFFFPKNAVSLKLENEVNTMAASIGCQVGTLLMTTLVSLSEVHRQTKFFGIQLSRKSPGTLMDGKVDGYLKEGD
ncbi:hypothetical protein Sjap_012134 [Stephania japonica]|uniref:Uncharacterized protein n=1 Tax=Stephania japonica TaxID=461633 RepID=A0AAP0IVC3_9MAGN